MFRRPSIRSTVTTLAAAAVLVGGADLASYAATGHPLILGHGNSAGTTTALKNTGRGPALSLSSSKHAPPLVVNSSKLVKHLNADRVGGRSASALEPKTIRFHLGSPGQTFAGDTQHVFSAKVPTGTYQIGLTGLLTESPSTSGDSYTCLIADKAKLLALFGGGSLSNFTGFYALDGDTQGSFKYGVLDDTNHAQKVTRSSIAYGCLFTGPDAFKVRRTLTFTLHPVTATDKSGTPLSITRSGARHLLRTLR
jgi:hypothetical protein